MSDEEGNGGKSVEVSVNKWLRLSGVPYRHIKKSSAKLVFSPVEFVSKTGRVIIGQEEQSSLYMAIMDRVSCLGESALYGIGSNPTETAAYQMAVSICRAFTEYCFSNRGVARITWIDLATPDWSFLKSENCDDVVVIHGLSDSSEPRRFELAKDFIRKSSDCTIFVLATTDNIIDMVIRRLGLQPTGVCQLSTMRVNIVV